MVVVKKCLFSGSEMISDAFDTTESHDGFIIEAKSEMVNKDAVNLDIGDADEVNDEATNVNNIVDGFQYVGMEMKKPAFMAYIKTYMQKLKKHLEENNPDRVAGFEKAAKAVVGMLVKRFDDCEFYLGGEDSTMEGHIGIAFWVDPEADSAPTFFWFKDGLKDEKY